MTRYGNGTVQLHVFGEKGLQKMLKGLPDEIQAAVTAEIRRACKDLKKQSMELCPVDKGDLAGSCYVEVTRSKINGIDAEVGYTEPYALFQHEDLTLRHSEGKQAKYLSQPFEESLPTIEAKVLDVIRREAEKPAPPD